MKGLIRAAVVSFTEGANDSVQAERSDAHASQQYACNRLGALSSTMRRLGWQPPSEAVGLLWQRALDCSAEPHEVIAAIAGLRVACGCGDDDESIAGQRAMCGKRTSTLCASALPPLERLVLLSGGKKAVAERAAVLLSAISAAPRSRAGCSDEVEMDRRSCLVFGLLIRPLSTPPCPP